MINKENFEHLFRDHFSALAYFARKYVQDLDTAKEIVHDVFIRIWEKRGTLDPQKAIKSYLYSSVQNRCLNYIRDCKKFDTNVVDFDQVNHEVDYDPSEKMVQAEIERQIQDAISTLPEKCREIFVMSRFEDMKYQEIADKLGISVKTVETQMSRALKTLRESLKEYITVLVLMLLYEM